MRWPLGCLHYQAHCGNLLESLKLKRWKICSDLIFFIPSFEHGLRKATEFEIIIFYRTRESVGDLKVGRHRHHCRRKCFMQQKSWKTNLFIFNIRRLIKSLRTFCLLFYVEQLDNWFRRSTPFVPTLGSWLYWLRLMRSPLQTEVIEWK